MKVTVLGSGSSGGVPLIGNYWGECDRNNKKNTRMRVSVSVELKNGKTIIIDTSPDLRVQALNNKMKNVDAKLPSQLKQLTQTNCLLFLSAEVFR